jgi:hypothetical protein
MKKYYFFIFPLLLAMLVASNVALAAINETPIGITVGAGSVDAIATDGETLYFGGEFSNVYTWVGAANTFSTSTSELIGDDFPVFAGGDNGEVYTAISDGDGGWYVGGTFQFVNEEERISLVHILSDNTVDASFDAELEANSYVYALALDGTTLYVGGTFTEAGGEVRNRLAAFDTTTGLVTDFDPNLDGDVNELLVDGDTLYVGGGFTDVNNGTTRNYLAAFDTGTSVATAFDPNLNDSVVSLALDGTTLYVGGNFTDVNNGTTRNYLAAFDTGTSIATAFDPNLEYTAYDILLDGTTLYAGGGFAEVNGGTTRNYLAAFDTGTSIATAFDPDVDDTVRRLALDGSTLYAVGDFNTANGGTVRAKAAGFDTGTSLATDFAPNFSVGSMRTVVLGDTEVLVGGIPGGYDPVVRNNLAAVDIATGELTDFDPNVDGSVSALLLDGTTLYVGGNFTDVNNGTSRTGLAAFDVDTSVATAFDVPPVDGSIYTLLLDGDTLYVGGSFSCFGEFIESCGEATPRNNLAAVNVGTSELIDFDPDINNSVFALELDGETLYVGGDFTSVNGGIENRNRLAGFSTTTGIVTGLDFGDVNDSVTDLLLNGNTLYASGNFTTVNEGTTRNGFAAFQLVDGFLAAGQATPLDFDIQNGTAARMYLDGEMMYVAGAFSLVNGDEPRSYMAAFDTDTGTASDFYPRFGNAINDMVVDDEGNIYVGGTFAVADRGVAALGLAYFEVEVDGDAPTIESLTPADNAVDVDAETLEEVVIVFNETVESTLDTECAVRFYDDTDLSGATIFSDSDLIAIDGDEVTVTLVEALQSGHEYHIEIDDCIFEDASGNPFAGIAADTTWNFSTAEEGEVPGDDDDDDDDDESSSGGGGSSHRRPDSNGGNQRDPIVLLMEQLVGLLTELLERLIAEQRVQ